MIAIFLFNFENYFCKEKPALRYITEQLINQEIDGRLKKIFPIILALERLITKTRGYTILFDN